MKQTIIISILCLLVASVIGQTEYEVTAVGKLNSPLNDFSARTYGNGVLFCSNKKNDILVSYLNEQSEAPLTQLYFSERKEFGKYGSWELQEFDEKFHTDNGPFEIGPDSSLYFSRSYPGKKGPVLGIFIARKNESGWSKPQPFALNHPDYMVGHPTFSNDGKRIYFSANFDDSHGKSDLYFCHWENGEWSSPENLGSEINSSDSELFPFFHPDGTLYFASDRSGGMGGMDIYQVDLKNRDGSAPQILSSDFNSAFNDFGYSVNADKSAGYFSSDRNGSDDLFEFRMVKPGFTNCDTLETNSYCYVFFDAANVALDTLPLRYEWDLGDGTRIRNLEVEHCFSGPGTYNVSLNIIDTLTGDLFFSQASYELVVEDIEQVYIEAPDSVALSNEVKMHGHHTYLPGFETDTYHWFIGDSIYLEGPEVTHHFNALGSHNVTLGLRSHPDANQLVRQECIQKQIRVIPEDEYALLASVNSVSSTNVESHESNKPTSSLYDYLQTENDTVALDNTLPDETIYRVEIKKSKERLSTLDQFFDDVRETYDVYENFIPSDSVFSYAIGDESALSNTYPIYTYVKSMNYDGANVKAYLPQHVYDLNDVDLISEADLNRAVFRTGAIYFETDKAQLKEVAYSTLDKIYELMEKYPTLQLEVGAHTDSIGNSEYNMKLSNHRAASVIEYLVQKNIKPARLIGVGYGSEMPIGDNRTEEGRQLNRRVEFTVVSEH